MSGVRQLFPGAVGELEAVVPTRWRVRAVTARSSVTDDRIGESVHVAEGNVVLLDWTEDAALVSRWLSEHDSEVGVLLVVDRQVLRSRTIFEWVSG